VNHKEVADKVETVSMGLGITSGIVAAGAALAAPTGLSALGVAIGITSAPLIVTVAPVIGAIATATGVISGGAYFYSKWKTKRTKLGIICKAWHNLSVKCEGRGSSHAPPNLINFVKTLLSVDCPISLV